MKTNMQNRGRITFGKQTGKRFAVTWIANAIVMRASGNAFCGFCPLLHCCQFPVIRQASAHSLSHVRYTLMSFSDLQPIEDGIIKNDSQVV